MRRASLVVVLTLALLIGGTGGLRFSLVEIAAAPYRFDLVRWEVSNLPDKWVHKFKSIFPWYSKEHRERLEDLQAFFRLGEDIRTLEGDLARLQASPSDESAGHHPHDGGSPESEELRDRLDSLTHQRVRLKAEAEEALESEISAVIEKQGLSYPLGIIFPPVDIALVLPPRVLVLSPRDRVERLSDLLLKPDMKLEDRDALERKILEEQDLAALVVGIGGIATYPNIVRADVSLLNASHTAAHEWLHAYWFFRPLGWNIGRTPEMNTLNETAADLAGDELGDRVYEAITGERREEPSTPSTDRDEETDDYDGGFNFDREMRKTRLRVDELLADGSIEEAEAYMEERRRIFVSNGFHIRKLNQAFFAFHGTYAFSPASVSPIGDEVKQLRNIIDSVGDFIRTVARFGSYQEFKDYLTKHSATADLEPAISNSSAGASFESTGLPGNVLAKPPPIPD